MANCSQLNFIRTNQANSSWEKERGPGPNWPVGLHICS